MTQKIKNALISVSEKSDLQKILPTLDKYKINLNTIKSQQMLDELVEFLLKQ